MKIEKIFAGDLKPGAVVTVAAIDFFDGLHDADRIYFFLVDAKPEFLFNPPPGSKLPIYAGLKVVVDGRVCGFTQHSNPGAYELDTPRPGENLADFPGPAEFERKLAASQAKVAELRRTTLAPAPDRAQIPGLVALIATRHPRSYPDQEDAITQFAASRLANFHDPASIIEAMTAPSMNGRQEFVMLSQGLATPAGREFVLQKMADPATPKAAKALLASALGEMGLDYSETNQNIAPFSYRPVPSTGPADNRDYLKRIVLLATDPKADPEICDQLLETLSSMGMFDLHQRLLASPAVRDDLNHAVDGMVDFYPRATEKQQARIELFCDHVGRESYARLKSADGLVIGEASAADPSQYGPSEHGRLALEYTFSEILGEPTRQYRGLVLIQQEDGKPIQIGSMDVTPSSGGGQWFTLPNDLPPGTYHVFIRVEADGKVIGKTHGFQTDIR